MISLTICSKSKWHPAMRREHALALEAVRQCIDVVFVEAPNDLRRVRPVGPLGFLRSFGGAPESDIREGLSVVARTVPIPGHRGKLAEAVDIGLLRKVLTRHADKGGSIVCNLPWQWPAVAASNGRRTFDCADDWTRLYPAARGKRFTELFRRIASEADEVVVASPELADLFSGRNTTIVPNGADVASVADWARPRPHRRSLVYLGTLSERFDSRLVADILRALPNWSLDLFGPCQYAGSADRPAPELIDLLTRFNDRLRWHGTIPRSEVAKAIDSADVVIVPSRSAMSEGQSSMKLYDTAARGRPVVVAHGVSCGSGEQPPGTYVAERPDEWAAAIVAADTESDGLAVDRIAWARANTWEQRWPFWAAAVFGQANTVGALA